MRAIKIGALACVLAGCWPHPQPAFTTPLGVQVYGENDAMAEEWAGQERRSVKWLGRVAGFENIANDLQGLILVIEETSTYKMNGMQVDGHTECYWGEVHVGKKEPRDSAFTHELGHMYFPRGCNSGESYAHQSVTWHDINVAAEFARYYE